MNRHWYPLTVFYDASCPVCATEMRMLKRHDRHGRLVLVDCSAPNFDDSVLAGLMISRADLMARLHARDAHGHWLVALDAVEAAYRAAGLERRAEVCASRRLRPLRSRVYGIFARNKIKRLGGCLRVGNR